MSKRGEGKTYKWIVAHVGYQDDWCLMWPFGSKLHGYGQMSHLGVRYYAHRLMCELAHGAPPSPLHEAAHSCGRGHEGCVNPQHLSWKTKSENLLDCRQHGTQVRSKFGIGGRLNAEIAQQIRELKGVKLQREIAEQFNVSESTVSDIWLGRTWTREPKIKVWTAEEDAKLRDALKQGHPLRVVAQMVGRKFEAVTMRMYRIGLNAQSGHHACKSRPNS